MKKPKNVKIIQITMADNYGVITHGLGSDQKVYAWNTEEGHWELDIDEEDEEDEDEKYDKPFDYRDR